MFPFLHKFKPLFIASTVNQILAGTVILITTPRNISQNGALRELTLLTHGRIANK